MTIKSLADLRNTPHYEWTWRGFLLPHNITLLSAHPKTGKTTLVFHLIRALFTGEPFLDQPTRRPSFLLYISEEADSLLAARASALDFQDSWPIGWVTVEPGRRWEGTLRYMWQAIAGHPDTLVVLDTLSRHWSVQDENSATEVDIALRPIFELIRTRPVSMLAIHHMVKRSRPGGLASRGSSAIAAAVDVVAELWRLNPWDLSSTRRVECYSRYAETPDNFQISLAETGYQVTDAGLVDTERRIILLLGEGAGLTSADMSAELLLNERTCQRALAQLHARARVLRTGSGSGRSPYRYSLPGAEEAA